MKSAKKIKPNLIFHLAAQPLILSLMKAFRDIDINVRGTLNVLEVIKKINLFAFYFYNFRQVLRECCKVVSYKEEDQLGGVDPYSASKSSAELTIRAYRESFFKNTQQAISSVRAGNVIVYDWFKTD